MEIIITEFENFMRQNGTHYENFYIGITNNPITRLRGGHNVTETIPHIYWSQPINSRIVREIEQRFLNRGCIGGPGGGDEATCYIYAYKITPSTRQ